MKTLFKTICSELKKVRILTDELPISEEYEITFANNSFYTLSDYRFCLRVYSSSLVTLDFDKYSTQIKT